MNTKTLLQHSILFDISKCDSSMRVTSLILHEYADDVFMNTYYSFPPENINDFIANKISAYLQRNFIDYCINFESNNAHTINRMMLRCRGIVADLKKYKHEPEIQYFFENLKYFLETDHLNNNFLEQKITNDVELEDYYGKKELIY